MRFWRIAAAVVALIFFFSSVAVGTENVTYSGVPGKWKRKSKETKEAEQRKQAAEEKGKKTVTITYPNTPAPSENAKKKQ